jgi:hypothetical protein
MKHRRRDGRRVNAMPIVITATDPGRHRMQRVLAAAISWTATLALKYAGTRPAYGQHCPDERGRDLPGRSGLQSSALDAVKHAALPAAEHAVSDSLSDSDSHGVNDPSGQARATLGARSGVAHAMVSCAYCDTDTGSGRQRAPPLLATNLALHREVSADERNTATVECLRGDAWLADRRRASLSDRGTTSFPKVVPEVVLSCSLSRDVNQGREMKVLTRKVDALDAPMIAIERVGKRGRAGHPQRVGRVFEPLAVQGSEPGRAEVLGCLQVARPPARHPVGPGVSVRGKAI